METEGELSRRGAHAIAVQPEADRVCEVGTQQARRPFNKQYSDRYVWYVIGLLSVVNVFNYMDRMALAVLSPHIKTDLQLSDSQLGLLVGFAFALFYSLCGIPIARWADRGVRRDIIAIAIATWSMMTALSGAAQNFWTLFVARMGIGIGEAGCLPPAQSLICDYVSMKRRSGVFAIHTLGVYAGMMIGMVVAGWLGEAIGWRMTFLALGLPGVALAVLVRVTLREPQRGTFDVTKEDQNHMSLVKVLGFLIHCRTYRLLLLFVVVNGFVQYGLTQWWPSFYARVFELTLSSIGMYLGVSIGVGSAIGLIAGGTLANRLAERDVKFPLVIGAAATFMSMPVAVASLFVSSAVASIVLVGLTGALWGVSNGPVVAALNSIVTSRMRATAGAITIFFTSVLGFGLGPFCVGLLSDNLTPSFGRDALRYALLFPIGLIPVMAVALCVASNKLQADLRSSSSSRRIAVH